MKKIGLAILVVALVVTVVAPAPVGAKDVWRRGYYPDGYYPNGYYPAADLRDAHRVYWDEGLVDEIGKVITLPFTLPMRVKSEWERLNTKATHWKKVRESYEKILPSQKEP